MATFERHERKSGPVYMAIVRIRGFPKRKKTFKRLTDARMWAQQTEAAIRTGELQTVRKTPKKKSLREVITRYRSDVLPHKAESTRRAEELILQRWETLLGDYSLSYIDSELVNQKLQELATEPDRRRKQNGAATSEKREQPRKSRKTIKHFRDLLALLFKYACKWDWAASDPMQGVDPITKLRNERTRYLDDDERKELLAACKASRNRQLYPLVVFALSTGGRKGEILGLTLDDVDLNREAAVFRNTKNGDTRAVPLVGHLKEILQEQIRWVKEQYKVMEEKPPKRWLFPSKDGQKPIDIRAPWEKSPQCGQSDRFPFP